MEQEETAIARQWLSKNIIVAANTNATMEELLNTVFSMQYVPGLYNKNHTERWRQAGVSS
jgi:hypothetical protein